MNYREWERGVPDTLRKDTLWRVQAYRLALFAADVGWKDSSRLAQDRRMRGVSDQLYRALGSVSANIAEGYSRGTGKDRARFYEYALGSARESRDWYYKARHLLDETVISHRLDLQTQIIRLLLKMIPNQRNARIREEDTPYELDK
jgi:four helix bundle protein